MKRSSNVKRMWELISMMVKHWKVCFARVIQKWLHRSNAALDLSRTLRMRGSTIMSSAHREGVSLPPTLSVPLAKGRKPPFPLSESRSFTVTTYLFWGFIILFLFHSHCFLKLPWVGIQFSTALTHSALCCQVSNKYN